jgi:riboflavin kinase/FMN adenylyltransferase
MKKFFSVRGAVTHGEGRAAKLGFPTVNLPLENRGIDGIYAALVLVDGNTYHAAAFADPLRKLLEAHLLDYAGDLYGKEVTVELYEKIRSRGLFEKDEDLSFAIGKDVEAVRRCFEAPRSA